MTESRWWTLAVAVAVVVLSALILWEQPPLENLVGAIASMVLLAIIWFAFGRRALTETPPANVIVAIAVLVLTVSAVYFKADAATIQCVSYPILWTVVKRLRSAIIGSAVLAVSVAVSMFLGLGGGVDAAVVAGTIQGIALIFSLALGLWITTISVRSHERAQLIEQLESTRAELAAVSHDAGAASERERLAREIHDTIAQDLAGLVLTAQRGLRELKSGNSAATEKQLNILEENARNALTETRALVASGAAVGVDGTGLATALGRLAERFERETGIIVTVAADDTASLDRDAEVVLLRCAQEALANVRKHSKAGTAALTLTVREGTVDLSIADDGAGFDPAKAQAGFGIAGLRERLALVHGTLDVVAAPGGGTMLVASLPAELTA